jgi:methyl-accepting chemotaxis protein
MFSSIRHRLLFVLGSIYAVTAVSSLLFQYLAFSVIYTVFLYLLMFSIYIFATYKVVSSITKPIAKAAKMMDNITFSDGRLSERLPIKGKDEIATLSLAYNNLISAISTRIVDISISLSTLTGTQALSSDVANLSLEQIIEQQDNILLTAAAVEKMSMTSNEVARNVVMTSDASKNAKEKSDIGCHVLSEVLNDIQTVSDNVAKVHDVVGKSHEDSNAVAEIINVINSIAEQTNLLALNAAIEAARAGEQGRGFAVVADEVRNLANRTQESTAEIHKMISVLQQGMATAVSIISENTVLAKSTSQKAAVATEALKDISDAIENIDIMTEQIAMATEQQNTTTQDTNIQVNSIKELSDKVSVNSMEVTQRSASVSESILMLIQQLRVFNVEEAIGLDLALAKSAHIAWKEKIRNMLSGRTKIAKNNLIDHTMCVLGKWYYGEGFKKIGHLSSFKAIETPHKKMHEAVLNAVQAMENKDLILANTYAEQVYQLSSDIVSLIEKMEGDFKESLGK